MNDPHLPSLLLEEILTGERRREEPVVATHLEACADCRARLAALEAEDRAFLIAGPPAAFVAKLVQPRRLWPGGRTLFAGLALAGACAVAVALWLPRGDSSDRVLMRGAASVELLVVDGDVLRPFNEVRLLAGTKLRFRLQGGHAGWACAFSTQDGRAFISLGAAAPITSASWLLPGTFAATSGECPDTLIVAITEREVACASLVEPLQRSDFSNRTGSALDHAGPWQEIVVRELPKVMP
jgi:hypothetical protein